MEALIQSIEQSLRAKAWQNALLGALTLPDICARIDQNEKKSTRKIYAAWFDKYIAPKYTHLLPKVDLTLLTSTPPAHIPFEMAKHVFLSGHDCYSLRCAMLHEGSDDTSNNKPENINKFEFVVYDGGGVYRHSNQSDSKLDLEVSEFCNDILDGARRWLKDIEHSKEKQEAVANLFSIKIL